MNVTQEDRQRVQEAYNASIKPEKWTDDQKEIANNGAQLAAQLEAQEAIQARLNLVAERWHSPRRGLVRASLLPHGRKAVEEVARQDIQFLLRLIRMSRSQEQRS